MELTEAECVDLLATDLVGRVAYSTAAGPCIVPVNYELVPGEEPGDPVTAIEFRTSPNSELAAFAVHSPIAFEIDHLDYERRRGWSVLALGRCLPVTRDAEEDEEVELWAEGDRSLLLRLTWDTLTGRRVGGEHWPHPVVSGGRRSY